MKKLKTESNIQKLSNFAFVLYEDSCSSDWKRFLHSLQIPTFYILHDKDIEEESGNPKKPHYHVMIMFENPRSFKTCQKIALQCGCANDIFENVQSRRGYARYLCHMDNPEKYQYSFSEVVSINGADYDKITKTEYERKIAKLNIVTEIMDFCDKNNIQVYADLLRYCSKHKLDWLELLMTYTGQIIKDYIKSNSWAALRPELKIHRFFVDEPPR